MIFRYAAGVMLVVAIGSAVALHMTRNKLANVKADLKSSRAAFYSLQEEVNKRNSQLIKISDLDEKKTKELTDAYKTIEKLRASHAAGNTRLRINADCDVPNSTETPGLDDERSPRLTDTARENYFLLRGRIEECRTQVSGLQEYIKTILE